MKKVESIKFPNSIQLFKFCSRVLTNQRNDKINDQDLGNILEFNPSDCSHWKRGEKNIRSVFALSKLSETLDVEPGILHDLANGQTVLEEAYFEYSESANFKYSIAKAAALGSDAMGQCRARIEKFVQALHSQVQFATPPLYLPELFRLFSFIQTQSTELVDRLSRVLKSKPGHYTIQYQKGDLKSQTRMSVAKDVARIILEAERIRFPELGASVPELALYENLVFTASLLAPKSMLTEELSKLDFRKNIVNELAVLFWAPKSLIGFQMQDMVRSGESYRPLSQSSNLNSEKRI